MSGRKVRRALVSAFDKDGIVEFCRGLRARDIEIVSTGGTARLLEKNDVHVVPVSEYTGFPEMLDGRVKTLHPRIHAGILALRSDPEHAKDLAREGIEPIDLVVVNLYPFERTAAMEGVDLAEVLEMIDIGGPTMVRAAAKNYADVGVVVDPSDYPAVLRELGEHGTLTPETRIDLAVKAFRHTASYDVAVATYLGRVQDSKFPARLALDFLKVRDLVYGENPHQAAAFYREPLSSAAGLAGAEQLQGKPLSFNNLLDFDAALGAVAEFPNCACVIVKHGNPCGVALGPEPFAAFRRALECDPTSAFGGVIAFNHTLGEAGAAAVAEAFYEGVIAPGFEDGAREPLRKKKNLRVLSVGELSGFRRHGFDLRRINGGLLVQEWDEPVGSARDARVATRRPPTEDEWSALEFAWRVVRHVKSNAIVLSLPDRTVGIGAGQMSRVDSVRFAIQKSRVPVKGTVMASDAFFPFRDGLDAAAEAGVTAVVQPGGSKRDQEVVDAADEHGIAMVLTGRRHFRH